MDENSEYKEGITYGINVCNSEFQVLLTDTYNKFNNLKRINKSDVERILTEVSKISLGDDFNQNMVIPSNKIDENIVFKPCDCGHNFNPYLDGGNCWDCDTGNIC